jgi:alkaline phosphatase
MTLAGYPSRGNAILGKAAINGVSLTDSLGLPYTTLSYSNGPGFTRDLVSGVGIRKVFNPASEGTLPATYVGTRPRPDLGLIDTADPVYLQEATVPMGAETHSGEEVSIYADGPRAYLFRGTLEQNVIYHVMADALGM